MDVNLTLVLVAGALIGCGAYLLLERSLTRVLVGLVLLGNGVNVAILSTGGPAGEAPFYGTADIDDMSDPLPQAMILTAIVITLGTVAFLLAMAHRSWQLTGHDDVQDDTEDTRIRRLAVDDATSDSFGMTTRGEDDDDPEEDGR